MGARAKRSNLTKSKALIDQIKLVRMSRRKPLSSVGTASSTSLFGTSPRDTPRTNVSSKSKVSGSGSEFKSLRTAKAMIDALSERVEMLEKTSTKLSEVQICDLLPTSEELSETVNQLSIHVTNQMGAQEKLVRTVEEQDRSIVKLKEMLIEQEKNTKQTSIDAVGSLKGDLEGRIHGMERIMKQVQISQNNLDQLLQEKNNRALGLISGNHATLIEYETKLRAIENWMKDFEETQQRKWLEAEDKFHQLQDAIANVERNQVRMKLDFGYQFDELNNLSKSSTQSAITNDFISDQVSKLSNEVSSYRQWTLDQFNTTENDISKLDRKYGELRQLLQTEVKTQQTLIDNLRKAMQRKLEDILSVK